METFGVAVPETISAETFGAMMRTRGANQIAGDPSHYSLARGDAAVYISLEDEKETDADALERVRAQVPWPPRSIILLTVGHADGSLFLAFEVADSLVRRWSGFIDWAGHDQWKEWFGMWKKQRVNRSES